MGKGKESLPAFGSYMSVPPFFGFPFNSVNQFRPYLCRSATFIGTTYSYTFEEDPINVSGTSLHTPIVSH